MVLTKILQIDQKLTFHVFHISNQGRISKIEKISDGTVPPKKGLFWGGSGALDEKDFGYVSGRKRMPIMHSTTTGLTTFASLWCLDGIWSGEND